MTLKNYFCDSRFSPFFSVGFLMALARFLSNYACKFTGHRTDCRGLFGARWRAMQSPLVPPGTFATRPRCARY